MGIWGAANFLGLPIGPILGGWLLSHYWWGSVFLMNLPVVRSAWPPSQHWCPNPGPARLPAWTWPVS